MKKEFFRMALPLVLAAMAFVLTGCPHNDYTVDLKPTGPAIVRKLTFYRIDGANYQAFDPQEMSAIVSLYPTNSLTNKGDLHIIRSEFGNQMPDDVGGAGTYTNLETRVGSAGFYVERFRGSEDLAGMTERRLKAADQMTDILLGWSRAELGKEAGYGQLQAFLDGDFRHDLKNASMYCEVGQIVDDRATNGAVEFAVRFGQYLCEKGYFKLEELPGFSVMLAQGDDKAGHRWVQRLVARKMGLADSAPIPSALDFLADDEAMEKSFTNYFVQTDFYHTKIEEWNAMHATNADAKPPTPDAVAGNMFQELASIDFGLFGETPDHLAVRLALPVAPLHSNGRWNETNGTVIWDSDLMGRENTNRLPVSCYANWVEVNEDFQTNHFGMVAFSGDDLVQYCLWRSSQNAERGGQWDAFLAGLKPGADLRKQVDAFRFKGETTEEATNNSVASSGYPRGLLTAALK